MKNRGYGSIRGDDGVELYFDESSLEAADFRTMWVGDRVEYDEQHWAAHVRAINVRCGTAQRNRLAHND